MYGKLVSLGGFVLRKFHGRTEACAQYGLRNGALTSSSVARPSLFLTAMTFVAMALVPLLGLAALALVAHGLDHSAVTSGLTLAFPTAVATRKKTDTPPQKPANIRQMEADLKLIVKDLELGQEELAAGPISEARGQELTEKAREMERLQAHIDQYNEVAGIVTRAHGTPKVTLPGEQEHIARKAVYTTHGHRFVMSDGFQQYVKMGRVPGSWSPIMEVAKRLGKKILLRGEEAVAFERKAFDPNTLPVLGEDAIIPVDRDPDIVRYEEPEILTIRDVLNVTPTTSDAIKYVKHTATNRAAESQSSRGGLKPFLSVEFDTATANVETIAVLSKVTEQDIQDAPRLVSLINSEMTLDVRQKEEYELVWGNGLNGNLLGLFNHQWGIPEFDRAEVDDTLIDVIRKMRTDLRKRRIIPTFVAIDPLDWEEIELAKGSDDRYIWGLVTDLRGPRIWSLRVVESDAMTDIETDERRILMGDGTRGATIYDRSSVSLSVGFMDDDFGRNLRTLRAEERLALAVKRAFAFEFAITSEQAS